MMGCSATGGGGGCDVIQNGHNLGCHLGFYPKIIRKRRKLKIVWPGHLEYDVITHFAAFVDIEKAVKA